MDLDYTVRTAVREMVPRLKTIWKACFDDSDDYIDFFFKNRFAKSNTVVAVNEGEVVGVIHLLPAFLVKGQREIPVFYGYAIGVLPEHRGRGICALMHDFLFKNLLNGKGYILNPANLKLENYYKSIGLTEISRLKECTLFTEGKGGNANICDITPGEYEALRNECFSRDGFIRWDGFAIDYAIKENNFGGGFCKKIIIDGKACAFLGKKQEDGIFITEAVAKEGDLPRAAEILTGHFGVKKATLFLPTYSKINGEPITGALGYNLDYYPDGYLNLMLN